MIEFTTDNRLWLLGITIPDVGDGCADVARFLWPSSGETDRPLFPPSLISSFNIFNIREGENVYTHVNDFNESIRGFKSARDDKVYSFFSQVSIMVFSRSSCLVIPRLV